MKKLNFVLLSFMLKSNIFANYVIVENHTSSTHAGKTSVITTSVQGKGFHTLIQSPSPDNNQAFTIWNDQGAFTCLVANKSCVMVEKKTLFDAAILNNDVLSMQLVKHTITPTNQKLKIANHNCDVYQIYREYLTEIKTTKEKSRQVSSERNCYAKSIQIYNELYKNHQMDVEKLVAGTSPNSQIKANILKELSFGYPIKREMTTTDTPLNVKGGTAKSYTLQFIVTSIQKKSLPDSLFQIPKDYKTIKLPQFNQNDLNSMMNPKSPAEAKAMMKKVKEMQNQMKSNKGK